MFPIRRLSLLVIACSSLMTHDVRAEHARYSGPLSCAVIAMEAQRGIVMDEEAGESPSAIVVDSSGALSRAPGPTTRPSKAKPKRQASMLTIGVRTVIGTALLEGLVAGFTRSCVHQEDGGYFFGAVMYGATIMGPVSYSEPIDGRPFHGVSLISCAAAAAVVGTLSIVREKHPPVDRSLMFQEAFIGFNVVMLLPIVIEMSIRSAEARRARKAAATEKAPSPAVP